MIDSFAGKYRFLSNFHPSPVQVGTHHAITVEHAYQASKTIDEREFLWVLAAATPGQAKRRGSKVTLRDDWTRLRQPIMRGLLKSKFMSLDLANKLILTGNQILIEGNTWGDTFWGMCNGRGLNKLGKMLMAIRVGLIQNREYPE